MRALALTIVILAAGCGDSHGNGGGCPSDGIVLLSWTVKEQPPTADQGCKGISSLTVFLTSECNVIEIEPVPCINGLMWRYDQLLAGPNVVELDAMDAQQNVIAQGRARVTLDSSIPATPTAIDLE